MISYPVKNQVCLFSTSVSPERLKRKCLATLPCQLRRSIPNVNEQSIEKGDGVFQDRCYHFKINRAGINHLSEDSFSA